MHRRRISIAAAVSILVVLAAAGSVTAATRRSTTAHLGGSWSGKYDGAVSGTFTLTWTQNARGKLTGAIKLSRPAGTYPITGHVSGAGIKFGAVGVGAVYTGKVSTLGLKMSGTWASGPGGGTWSAHRLVKIIKIKLP
jgi:hypothetical protein